MTQKDTHGAVAEVAPAMAAYAERFIEKDLWNRPELSRRDRSLVTIAALISRNDTAELPHYLNVALDTALSIPQQFTVMKMPLVTPYARLLPKGYAAAKSCLLPQNYGYRTWPVTIWPKQELKRR